MVKDYTKFTLGDCLFGAMKLTKNPGLDKCGYSGFGIPFKGYLCYKTITSQNVSSEAQVKNFFISKKSYVIFSRYS